MTRRAERMAASTAALPTTTVGSRPTPSAMAAWACDTESRDAVADFVRSKGDLRVGEAILCALYWLERMPAHAASSGPRPVSACEIAMLYPHHDGRRVRLVADRLRHLAGHGLAEGVGTGWYRTLPLGAAVVEALPDRRRALALRGEPATESVDAA